MLREKIGGSTGTLGRWVLECWDAGVLELELAL